MQKQQLNSDFINYQLSASELKIENCIYNSSKTAVFQYKIDSKNYILKSTDFYYPTLDKISMLKHEYELLKSIDSNFVIKTYGLIKIENGLAIVLEDCNGTVLLDYANKHREDLKLLLDIFIETVEGLNVLHKNNIIHKDIKPQNILVNQDNGSVKIIDLDISTKTLMEKYSGDEVLKLEGTLAYLSPEQTGRMNRSLDYRTDFYSLGTTFFEVFTGRKVFPETEDKLELIHSHIAKLPDVPKDINSDIPKALSDILLKLLEKRAEDRYQSSLGILNDLKLCKEKLKIDKDFSFIIAQKDVPEKFKIPEKLYGRENEVEKIYNCLNSSNTDKTQLIMISGNSGVGKSFLVQEVQKPISKDKGFFLSGKYDQLKKDVPYSALIEALEQFLNILLTYTEKGLEFWKNSILDHLGSNASILNQMIPDFSIILGQLPLLEELSPQEAQIRFQQTIINFFKIFSNNSIPIVIFLDDLQWADSSMITLIEKIFLEPELKNILIIGSYRDNEVKNTHPLSLMIETVGSENKIETIVLKPLTLESIKNILIDSFYRREEEISELATVIQSKTGGNPFFVLQFLTILYKERAIFLNENIFAWDWELDKIKNSVITDNVVELLSDRLKKLEPEELKIIKYAACIGKQFSLRDLSLLIENSHSNVARLLQLHINEGFVIPLSKDYLYAINSESDLKSEISYKFQHDKIQQASYELLDLKERKSLHLKIARNLFSISQKENNINDILFDLLNHWNQSLELVTGNDELISIRNYNYEAGIKAKSSGAYSSALQYFEISNFILDKLQEGESDIDFKIHLEMHECQYLTDQYDDALNGLNKLESIYNDKEKLLYIYNIKIRLYTKWSKIENVIKILIAGLRIGGITIPDKTSLVQLEFLFKLISAKIKLIGKGPDYFKSLPKNEEDKKGFLINIMFNDSSAALFSHDQNLFLLISLKMFLLALEKGNLPGVCYSYLKYSIILLALNDFDGSFGYARLAMESTEFFPDRKLDYWRMRYCKDQFQIDWEKKIRDTVSEMEGMELKLIESGDPIYSGYAVIARTVKHVFLSQKLDEFLAKNVKHLDYFDVTKNLHCYYMYNPIIYSMKNLAGLTNAPDSFSTDTFNEEIDREHRFSKEPPMQRGYYTCFKILSLYHMGYYKEAAGLALESVQYVSFFLGMLMEVELNFYIIVSLLADYDSSKSKYIKIIKSITKTFEKYSKLQKDNYNHLLLFIYAEKERKLGSITKAIDYYEKAISVSHEGGFFLIEAKACERLGEIEKEKRGKAGLLYLTESFLLYESLGAKGKSFLLLKAYPEIRSGLFSKFLMGGISSDSTLNRTSILADVKGNKQLDYDTIIKSSQKISAEIGLEGLLNQLVDILITNAGATKGIFLSYENGKLKIEVSRTTKMDHSQDVPNTIIQHVINKKHALVLNNVPKNNIYNKDEYIQKNNPLSIICIPIKKQSEIKGILYLENDLTTDAFTKDRLELMNILASQASISIENARLYNSLEQKVEERTKELNVALAVVHDQKIQVESTLEELKETQEQLIHAEKFAALGQLVAGVAHEINNPIGAIQASAERIEDELEFGKREFPEYFRNLQEHEIPIFNELLDRSLSNKVILTTKEERNRKKIIKQSLESLEFSSSDKRSLALEYLSNLGITDRLDTYFTVLKEDKFLKTINIVDRFVSQNKSLRNIYISVEKASKVVFALRKFLNTNIKTEKKTISIREELEKVIKVYDNYINGFIEVSFEIREDVKLTCLADEMSQVWRNIIFNSIQAMYSTEKNLKITLECERDSDNSEKKMAIVKISDTGMGMTQEIKEKVYTPFFTTKPAGEGIGLGLFISHRIIEEHGGEITFTSEVGNTEFVVRIPI